VTKTTHRDAHEARADREDNNHFIVVGLAGLAFVAMGS
jgi:hypothetical protein